MYLTRGRDLINKVGYGPDKERGPINKVGYETDKVKGSSHQSRKRT